jgi:hypothetical protein
VDSGRGGEERAMIDGVAREEVGEDAVGAGAAAADEAATSATVAAGAAGEEGEGEVAEGADGGALVFLPHRRAADRAAEDAQS